MACFENFSSNFFSNFNISYTIPVENVENVNIFYGKVNFKSQIINFNLFLFPIHFQCKNKMNVLLIKIAFFAFLLPFFEAFG